MRVLFIIVTLLFSCSFLHGQTVYYTEVYDYSAWSISSPACSFGSSGTTIGGRVHKTILGIPKKSSAPNRMELTCYQSGGNDYSDQFAIEFPFKAGYKYQIEARCVSIQETGTPANYAQIFAELTNNTYTQGSCTGYQIVTGTRTTQTVPYGNDLYDTTKIVSWNFEPTEAKSRIEMGVMPTGNLSRWLYVKSVRIKIVGLPALTVTPDALPLSCGSSASQTFTVTNNSNVSDISSVVWTLPSGNGWSHASAGSEPTTINTGTTLSLTLNPLCGPVQSDIIVTITFGTEATFTRKDTVDVSVSVPGFSISGTSPVCSTQTFTFINAPCSGVTWTGMDANVSPSSPATGNPITITKINSTSFTLTGTVTYCGATYTATKLINVGPAIISNVDFTDYVQIGCHISGYKFQASSSRATTHVWTYDDGTGPVSFGGNTNQATLSGDESCTNVMVRATAYNACNASPYPYAETASDLCTPYDDPYCYGMNSIADSSDLLLYPNPSTSSVTISLKSGISNGSQGVISQPLRRLKDIRHVIIYDKFGQIVMQQNFIQGRQLIQFNINMLRPDIYTVYVSDGIKSSTVKLFKN